MSPVDKTWVRVCELDKLPTDRAVNVHINGQRLVVVRSGETACILQGYCSHMLYALKDAQVADNIITCNLHGSQFDIRDGSVLHWPLPMTDDVKKRKMLRTYETRTEAGVLYVSWPADDPDKVRVRL